MNYPNSIKQSPADYGKETASSDKVIRFHSQNRCRKFTENFIQHI